MRNKISQLKLRIAILLVIFCFLPSIVHATDLGFSYGQYSGLSTVDVRYAISVIIRVVLSLLGIITLVMMLYAGYSWMTSGGSQEKIEESKKTITRSVIGLIIILSAYAITTFIFTTVYPLTFNVPYGSCPSGSCINSP